MVLAIQTTRTIKKWLIALILCSSISTTLPAQKIMIGFNTGFLLQVGNSKDATVGGISFEPTCIYMLTKNLGVGPIVGIGYSSEYKTTTMGAAATVVYRKKIANKLYYMPNIAFGISKGFDESGYNTRSISGTLSIASLDYHVSERISLGFTAFTLGIIRSQHSKDQDKTYNTLFDIGINATPTLSFSYWL